MSTRVRQAFQSAAGAAGGGALNVEDVFSTYLYTGNSASQPINNGVDLAGQGGMVWAKARDTSYNHLIWDSERGSTNGTAYDILFPNLNNASNSAASYGVTSFNSNGFTLGPSGQQSITNQGGASYGDIDYASWTFRKARKFFDVVTYTGNGTSGRTVSHNLGSTPGCIIIKGTSSNYEWSVYHRGIDSTAPEDYFTWLNHTYGRFDNTGYWNDTAPTSTQFTLGNNGNVNASGQTYVAYLFAHNDGNGGFGPDGDADIIKCGSYTGGSGNTEIDLGFEPQWLMIKRTDSAEDWLMLDVMRGLIVSGDDVASTGQKDIMANTNAAEATPAYAGVSPQSNGFKVRSGLDALYSANGGTYIYIAIRRGPMAVPESATDVFKALAYTGNNSSQDLDVGFPVDTVFIQNRTKNYTYNNWVIDRIRGPGKQLYTDMTNSTSSDGNYKHLDNNFGLEFTGAGNLNGVYGGTPVPYIGYFYRQAAGFFDVVAYTGTGQGSRSITHNLGVSPELVIVKQRTASSNWFTWCSELGNDHHLFLNAVTAKQSSALYMRSATDTAFNLGNQASGVGVNSSGVTHIMYLFASLPGISKVGSYTGNGASQTINCGFTSGASFIMIKRTDSTGNWYQWDTERGIVSGNDPHLGYNISGPTAENSSYDSVDPNNSGFNVVQNSGTNINVANATYIFHAIA
jgi:hypothetical protein